MINPNEVLGRMKQLLLRPFCPKCYLFLEEHNDKDCNMRYIREEIGDHHGIQ